MASHYDQLLDATLQHLQQLKQEGVRFVSVSPTLLHELAHGPAVIPAGTPSASSEKLNASQSISSAPTKLITPVPSVGLTGGDKALAMAQLREKVLACIKCPHLVASRKSVVFGVGTVDASLMFVGEAPGADEDQEGEPFVGRAGQLLTRIIVAMGLNRETVYIANILKCRPDTPGQAFGNRKPTPEEMETCSPYLQQQIDIIQPKVLVALGATAVEGLLGKPVSITKLRGQWQNYRGTPLMPTFHPSFLLRPENAARKREVWEDMLQVMQKLEMPITEKQRNYFTKG